MRLPILSLFPNTQRPVRAAALEGFSQHGLGVRAMALLTAVLIFLQGPVSLLAAVWDPFSELASLPSTYTSSTVGGGTFANTGVGGHWENNLPPGPTEIAQFKLFSAGYTVLMGSATTVGGLAVLPGSGTPGTTVTLAALNGTAGLTLGASGINLDGGNLFLAASVPVALGASQTWTVAAGTLLHVASILSAGSAGYALTKAGAGQLYLDAAATYSGATNITGGEIETNDANYLPTTTDLTIGPSGTLRLGGAQTLASLQGSGNLVKAGSLILTSGGGHSFSGSISGSGDVSLNAGTLTLGGANTYSGITYVNAGAVLKIANAAALGGTGDNTRVSSGATLDANGQTAVAEAIMVNGVGVAGTGALVNHSATEALLTGVVTLQNNSSIGGAGTLNLAGGVTQQGPLRTLTKVGAGVLILSAPSSFTGSTTIAEGILKLNSVNALGNGSANTAGVSVTSGAALDLNGVTSAVAVPLTLNSTGVSNTGALTNTGAAAAFGGALTLASASSIGGNITLTGALNGAQTLTKVGAGNLVLAGASNGVSAIVLDGGTLSVGAGSTTGTLGTATVASSAHTELIFNRSDDYAGPLHNTISGNGSVTLQTGTLTLTGFHTYTGPTTVRNGATLAIGTGGTQGSLNSDVVLEPNTFLRFNRSDEMFYGGSLSGAGTFTKAGGGTLGLFHDSDLSAGSILVAAGILSIGTGGTTGSLAGDIANSGIVQFNRSNNLVYAGSISGTGAISSIGTGSVTLTATQTYSGATNVSAGTLTVGSLSHTSSINVSGGTFHVDSFNAAAPLTLSNAATVKIAGADLGLGGILNNATSGGTLHFTASAGTIRLGSLTGTGSTGFASNASVAGTIASGILSVAATLDAVDLTGGTVSAGTLNAATVSGGVVSAQNTHLQTVSGGSITLSGLDATIQTLYGGTIRLANAATILQVTDGEQSASGSISGGGTLRIQGPLTLAAANSYTGGTRLDAGTLTLGHAQALGAGTLRVEPNTAALNVSAPGLSFANQIELGGALHFLGTHSLTAAGSLVLYDHSTLHVAAQTLTLAGSIVASANSLTKEGAGTLALTGTGSEVHLAVNGGVVSAATGAFGATATVATASPGTLSLLGSQSITSIDGTGTLLLGSSSLNLSAGGNYSGVMDGDSSSFLQLTGGNLTISGTSNTFRGTLRVDQGAIDLDGSTQTVGFAHLNGGTITNGTLNFSSLTLSSGHYSADLAGSGTLIKDATPNAVSLNGDNAAFTGSVRLRGGTLTLASPTAVGAANDVFFDVSAASPTLTLTDHTTIASLSGGTLAGGSVGFIHFGGFTLTLSGSGNTTYGGSMTATGTAAIHKIGTGTQVLAGDATGADFGGGILISAGVLEIANPLALGSNANPIELSGGTLALTSPNVLAGPHPLAVTASSNLVLGGTLDQELGALTLTGTLHVTAAAGATGNSVQTIAFGTTNPTGAYTLDVGSSASVVLGDLSDSFTLTKSGNGALTLTGAQVSSGTTIVTGGSLRLGLAAVLPSGSLVLEGATTVLDLGDTIQAVDRLQITGATVRSGSLDFGAGPASLANAAVFANLTGTGGLTSSGTTTLSGQNAYTGDTTVLSGSLIIASTGSLFSGGTLSVSNGARAQFLGTDVPLQAINGLGMTLFSGTARVIQNLATGTLQIAGDARLAEITGATVAVGGAATADLSAGSLTLNGSGSTLGTVSGGTLILAANRTAMVGTLSGGNVTASGTLEASGGTFAGALSGVGSLAVTNGNTLMLNGTLAGFTGLYLAGGNATTLSLGVATSGSASLTTTTGATAQLNFAGAKLGEVLNNGLLTLAGGTYTLGALSGSGVVSAATASSLRVGTLGSQTTFSGSLTGGIALTKEGTGRLVLLGNSDYTGNTTVAAGVLVAGTSRALSSGSVTVHDGATLALANGSVLENPVSLSGVSGPGALVNRDGNNRLTGLLTLTGDTQLSFETSGSLATGSVTALPGIQANLSVLGTSGASLTVGGTISLGANVLVVQDTQLTLQGAVTAGEVILSGGSARLDTDLNASLNLINRAAVAIANNVSVVSLGSDEATLLDLGGNRLTVRDGAGLTANGTLSGSGSLTLETGTLTLGGFNTYAGGTTVNGGFLSVTGGLFNHSALTIHAGTAQFSNPALLGNVSNNGLIRFLSTATIGTLTGTGSIEFAGGVNLGDINGGSLTIATANPNATTSLGVLSSMNLTVASQSTATAKSFEGATATVVGTLNISGEVSAGFLTNNGSTSVGTLTAGTIATGTGSQLNVAGGTFVGTLSGVGTLNTTGVLTITSTAELDTSLLHTVSSTGSLTLASVRALGSVVNNGSISFLANGSVAALSGTGTTRFTQNADLGAVSGGDITVAGLTSLGTLSGGLLTATGSVTAVSLTGGTLTLGAGGNTLRSVSGGTLQVNGSTGIDLLSGGLIQNASQLLVGTFNGGNVTNFGTLTVAGGTFAGLLSGTGPLDVNGNLTLSGTQTAFAGAVTVNTGTLWVTTALGTQNTLSVSALGSARFGVDTALVSLANAGSVTFAGAVQLGSLTGFGTTTVLGAARMDGGMQEGTVDLAGASILGAVTGGTLTLRHSQNTVASISGAAKVDLLGQATVTDLSGGNITNSGTLNVVGGVFTGTLLGSGSLHTTGAFTIASGANLGSALHYSVADSGLLTFAGSLRIGALHNSGNVTFNGGGWTTQTGTGTVTVASGALSVAGGTGALVVNNGASAAYSSPVSLSSVENRGLLTLPAGSSVQTLNSTGTLTSAGLLTVSAGSITAFGGTAASLTKTGPGLLVLSGTNTYTGPTTISGGTLSLHTGATLPNGNVIEISSGGVLRLNGQTLALSRLSLSEGSILGAGTISLSAADYTSSGAFSLGTDVLLDLSFPTTGNTTLNSGSFTTTSLGGASSFVTIPTDAKVTYLNGVTVNGTLRVEGSLTVNGSLTANSATPLTLTRGATLVLSGTNASINVGTLAFGSNALEAGGMLRIDAPTTFAGTLSGSGTLTSSNGSTLTLASGSALDLGYSPGRLDVATLKVAVGTATAVPFKFEYVVGAANAAANNPTATLDYGALATGSLNSDRVVLHSGGTLVLGAPYVISVLKSTTSGSARITDHYPHQFPLVVLNGGTLSGGTTAVTAANLHAFFTNSATNSVVVVGTPTLVAGGSVNMVVQRRKFASFGTGNVAAVGALFDRSLSLTSGPVSDLIDTLDAKHVSAEVTATFTALNPGVYAELGNIGLDRLRDIQSGIANHIDMLALDAAGPASLSLGVKLGQPAGTPTVAETPTTPVGALEQSRVWTTAFGGWGRRQADAAVGTAGYSSNHYGDVSGVETKVGSLTLGILGAAGTSTANFGNGRGRVTSDSWHTGFYGNLPAGCFVLDASFAYGQSESNLRRTVDFPGGGATSGKSQGAEWTGQIGLAAPRHDQSGSLVITPSLHLLHSSVTQNALTESALNGLQAVVKGNSTDSTAVRTGLQVAKLTKVAKKAARFTASLDWVRSIQAERNAVDIGLAGSPATARFRGSKAGQDALRVGLGAEVALTGRTRLRLNVDQQLKNGVESTYGSASFGLQF